MPDADGLREWIESKADPRRTTVEIEAGGEIQEFEIEALTTGEDETFKTLSQTAGAPDLETVFAITLHHVYDPGTGEQVLGGEFVERALEAGAGSPFAKLKTKIINFTYGVGEFSGRDVQPETDGDEDEGENLLTG